VTKIMTRADALSRGVWKNMAVNMMFRKLKKHSVKAKTSVGTQRDHEMVLMGVGSTSCMTQLISKAQGTITFTA